MSDTREVVVVGGVRSAIGTYGGSLKDVSLGDLSASVVKEAVSRAGLAGEDVGHTVFGNVIHTEPRDMYLARVASVNAGIPVETPALTLNRLCGSGLQAILTAASYIQLGETDCSVGGGGDAMSRAPYWIPSGRWGQRMGDGAMVDAMVGALTDPFDKCHMGMTAENVAEKWGISREEQDRLAAESHRRAIAAIDNGYFKEQILPVEMKSRKGTITFDTDEGPRRDVDPEKMAGMKPVFKREGGTVTAGNASSLNDGAAAVVMMEAGAAEARGLKPMARLVYGTVAVVKDLELDEAKVNPNGSGISLGHPIGATGANLTVKALYELERTGGRYAVVTMCIGGGQGIAALFERM